MSNIHSVLETISAFTLYKDHGRKELEMMYPEHLAFCLENDTKSIHDVQVELLVNTDLSGWDKQFKGAIKKGADPEGDLFSGMTNDFDSKRMVT